MKNVNLVRAKLRTKLLCIHLPQFHAIPENNAWWGEGFTEWTNVKRGKSWYPGHYQPRVPLNMEYYDLADGKFLEKQIQMARRAGIYGFCFYHYYFDGKTLLEAPIEYYRDKSSEQFPYCLIWANQSFARTWYGVDRDFELLLKQKYGREPEWKKHFEYLLPFFKDDRYIKIDDKPLYIIYLPQDIHVRKEMIRYWNELAIKSGFNGIYLIAMKTSKEDVYDLYDAYMYFEPANEIQRDKTWKSKLKDVKERLSRHVDINRKSIVNYFYANNVYSYKELCKRIEKKNKCFSQNIIYPGIFAGWDNTARKDSSGLIVKNSSPEIFEKHVRNILNIAERNGSEFVFLNAWNEWSEGAYIEPDEKYGDGYLEALRKVLLEERS